MKLLIQYLIIGIFLIGVAHYGARTIIIEKFVEIALEKHVILLTKIFGAAPKQIFSTEVTVTAYTARTKETDADPWLTADMSLATVGMLAVSRDLLNKFGLYYGQIVILEGYGVFRVSDTMNKRFTKRVDILMAHPRAAWRFGKRKTTLTWTDI